MLAQVKEFLAKVTAEIPNQLPAHHGIVLLEDGMIELALFFHQTWVLPIRFDESDFNKPIDQLVAEVVQIHADFMRGKE